MRAKRDYRTTSLESYKKWRKTNKPLSKGITYSTYKLIIETYNQSIIDHIIETGDDVKLPYGMGRIGIRRVKPRNTKKKKVDYHKTKLHGKTIYLTNYHTEGYDIKPKWFQKDARFAFSKIYRFLPIRSFSRAIPTELKFKDSKEAEKYKLFLSKAKQNFFK